MKDKWRFSQIRRAQREKFIIYFAIIFLASILGMVFLIARTHNSHGIDKGIRKITIYLGPHILSIPDNDFLLFPKEYGEGVNFALLVLLPNFIGQTSDNQSDLSTHQLRRFPTRVALARLLG